LLMKNKIRKLLGNNYKSFLRRIYSFLIIVVFSLIIFLLYKYKEAIDWDTTLFYAGRVFNIIFGFTVFAIIIIITLENRNPERTAAWLLVLVFLPVIGFVFYWFFGRNIRKNKIFSLKKYGDVKVLIQLDKNYRLDKRYKFQSPLSAKINTLLYNNSKALLTMNNSVIVFADAEDAFRELLSSIDKAEKYIHLEYFSVTNDASGREFKDVIIKKAKQGVKIRLLLDGMGCFFLSDRYVAELVDSGVDVQFFLPVYLFFLNNKLNYRNHRKIVIIDGKAGFLGGLNIGNKYLGRSKYYGYWRDTQMKFEGDAVNSLQAIFLTDWYFQTEELIFSKDYFPESTITKILPVQVVASGPDSDWAGIMQVYFQAIAGANKSILITTPYIVINESIIMSLKTAALSGVEVRIIVPGIADHLIVFWATRSYFEELMEAGIKIYEYKKGFIHSKQLIVDSEVAFIGTANMDMRSFIQNFETNVLIYDKEVIEQIEKQFEEDILLSREIDPIVFCRRSSFKKVKESISRLFSPLL